MTSPRNSRTTPAPGPRRRGSTPYASTTSTRRSRPSRACRRRPEMELLEAMRHSGTTRYYRTDEIPEAVIATALEAARFAPNGGNRQPTRLIVVRDAEQRRRLAELYLPHWKADLAQYLDGRLTSGST